MGGNWVLSTHKLDNPTTSNVAMMFPAILTVVSFFAVVLICAFSSYRRREEDKARPVPTYPIVGSAFFFWKNRGRFSQCFTELLRDAPSNTIKFQRPSGKMAIVTANPANVEHILKTRFEIYPKGDYNRLVMNDLLGDGIFNADGEAWKFQRKVASYEFNTRSLRDFIAETVNGEVVQRLLPLLRKAALQGKSSLDMQDVLKRFAFDNICKVAFGADPACLDISLPQSHFMEAFDTATYLTAERFFTPLPISWKLKRLLNVGSERHLSQAIRSVHLFAEDLMKRRNKELSLSSAAEPEDLLSRFLSLHRSSEGESYGDFVRDIVISFILAGRDTTSAALTWFFWLLSSHPHVEKNIELEVKRVIAARDEISSGFSYEELKEMNYLQASLCESMRLYPPVPSDSKEALQDDVLPDGTIVSKGTRVTYHPYAMGRMESIWGADCLEFKPERWLKKGDNGSLVCVAENAFKYAVFQAGPRICLGKEMAFTQMKCIVASVITEFRLDVDPNLKPKFVSTLTSGMSGGLYVKVVEKTKED
ncbi:hypothetical protein SUGI_0632750 [Cryptomeria japonica]|uniref:cytochrome P450 94B3 n=1 Tax=Cryptomeria japonica TaxID=3369 RepID=UPI0024147460|nr:cytochrome P450 94B3 [Cryptomeria japonica]GLJ31525.1 hypothetical protein SUGI_0632750 [Cryptomeria japonica]